MHIMLENNKYHNSFMNFVNLGRVSCSSKTSGTTVHNGECALCIHAYVFMFRL